MNSQEIRARIAELEALARRRARAEAAQDRSWDQDHAYDAPDPAAEDAPWDWDFLFDLPPPNRDRASGGDFSLRGWLVEGLSGLRSHLRSEGLDEEFWGHMQAAERELLLAWRSLIDARLQRLGQGAASDADAPERRQNIDIEFEDV